MHAGNVPIEPICHIEFREPHCWVLEPPGTYAMRGERCRANVMFLFHILEQDKKDSTMWRPAAVDRLSLGCRYFSASRLGNARVELCLLNCIFLNKEHLTK